MKLQRLIEGRDANFGSNMRRKYRVTELMRLRYHANLAKFGCGKFRVNVLTKS